MKFPIKLNRQFFKSELWQLFPCCEDPAKLLHNEVLTPEEFAAAVSPFSFNGVYKTTEVNRYPITLEYLRSISGLDNKIILDVGASDGSASIELIKTLTYKKYYLTDANITVQYKKTDSGTYFYSAKTEAVLFASEKIIVYPDTTTAIFPFGIIAKKIFRSDENHKNRLDGSLELINPLVKVQKKDNSRLEIVSYDLFQTWEKSRADIILAANILNPGNFTRSEFFNIFKNLFLALNDNGVLVIVDNRDNRESATVFEKKGKCFSVIDQIENGCSILTIVQSWVFED